MNLSKTLPRFKGRSSEELMRGCREVGRVLIDRDARLLAQVRQALSLIELRSTQEEEGGFLEGYKDGFSDGARMAVREVLGAYQSELAAESERATAKEVLKGVMAGLSYRLYESLWHPGVEFELWRGLTRYNPYKRLDEQSQPTIRMGEGELTPMDRAQLYQLERLADGWWHMNLVTRTVVFVKRHRWMQVVEAYEKEEE